MSDPEIHRTIERASLLEKLSIDLEITDEAYRSDHTLDGEMRLYSSPDKQVLQDRRDPPRHPLTPVGDAIREAVSDDETGLSTNFPSTTCYVGVVRTPPSKQDDDLFQDDQQAQAMTVDGIPDNGTMEFDVDWSIAEAEGALAENETRIQSREYEVEGLGSDRLPIVVRASLERDAAEYIRRQDDRRESRQSNGDTDGINPLVQRLEGQALLEVELKHRNDEAANRGPLSIDGFQLKMSQTFPQIEFDPQDGANYNPESRQVKWSGRRVTQGDSVTYRIIGPISELLSIDTIEAKLRGKMAGGTMSGTKLVGLYDETGQQFAGESSSKIDSAVTVMADIEIDPSALHGEAQEVSRATVEVNAAPKELYQKLADIIRRNNMHIQRQSSLGDAEPVHGRDGVFRVSDDQAGEYEVRREYGDRGVVYATLEVTGQYAAISEESQVSSFDESEDQIVRADQSGLNTRGRSTVEMRVRSASPELNSEFVSTLESEVEDLGGAF